MWEGRATQDAKAEDFVALTDFVRERRTGEHVYEIPGVDTHTVRAECSALTMNGVYV